MIQKQTLMEHLQQNSMQNQGNEMVGQPGMNQSSIQNQFLQQLEQQNQSNQQQLKQAQGLDMQ